MPFDLPYSLSQIDTFLCALALGTALSLCVCLPRSLRSRYCVSVGLTTVAAFVGARLFHALIEKPELFLDPQALFTRTDGMTFNGALVLGAFSVAVCSRLFPKPYRVQVWNLAAIATALSYGILRIGCFLKGCCWGKIAALPWSIRYSSSPVMPWLELPVHPVQLYDAVGALLISGYLLWRSRSHQKTQILPLFFLLYASLRFCTEFFRGDAIRGDNILWGLSTSQLVSLVLITGTLLYQSRLKIRYVLLGTLFFSTGCLPHPPSPSQFDSVSVRQDIEVYEIRGSTSNMNLVLVAADDNIQTALSPEIRKAYGRDTRIEDIAFWHLFSSIKKKYQKIIRISTGRVSSSSFTEALSLAESMQAPYDLLVLTHGLPNHLSTGDGYFYSYRDLTNTRFSFLNLVMLQSCFGRSLAQDWIRAGANTVISFDQFTQNFFYFDIFLKLYARLPDAETAYSQSLSVAPFVLNRSPYKSIRSRMGFQNVSLASPSIDLKPKELK